MTTATVLLLLIWIAGMIGFPWAGWTARTYLGERWLPHLAAAWVFGPWVLTLAVVIALSGFDHNTRARDAALHVGMGVAEFALYAILALMLYLIARRLPEDSPNAEDGD